MRSRKNSPHSSDGLNSDRRLKALLFRSPKATQLARIAKALTARVQMNVHDPDFLAINSIRSETGLALDIGANTGQSAISILAIKPKFEVLSLEPNPACKPMLSVLSTLFGDRLRVLHVGAGAKPEQLTFYIPIRNGRELLQEGTFDPTSLDDQPSIDRVGHRGIDYELSEQYCQIIRIDDLDINPAFIKIDVQGLEFEVLNGMLSTIQRSSPLIMLERGSDEAQCAKLLADYGYKRRYFSAQKFVEHSPGSINVFFVPNNWDQRC